MFCFTFSVGVWADNEVTALEGQTIEDKNLAPERIIVDEKNNAITFTRNTVTASTASGKSFADVADNAWYAIFVSHLTQLGIINGITDTAFMPDKNVTRAEFAILITSTAKADLSSNTGVTSFADVPFDAWYAKNVQWAAEKGIIYGRSNLSFAPEAGITREEAAVMVYRLAQFQNSRVIGNGHYEITEEANASMTTEKTIKLASALNGVAFIDSNAISFWAKDAVEVLNTAGVVAGDSTGAFNPQKNILRSESAKLLSAYVLFDQTPKIQYEDTKPVEYIEDGNKNTDTVQIFAELGIEEGTDIHGVGSLGVDESIEYNASEDESTLSWAGTTHSGITGAAFSMINRSNERPYIYSKMSEVISSSDYVKTGLRTIRYFAVETDSVENDGFSYLGHFYDASTRTSYAGNQADINAFKRFNNHYYNALVGYRSNKYYSYKEFGMACHYIEDLNAPHHAALKTAADPWSNHSAYESWVNQQFNSFDYPTMTYSSYRFMYDYDPRAIADNFSSLAKTSYSDCKSYSYSATQTNIYRTERAITGFLNAYYYKAGLNG